MGHTLIQLIPKPGAEIALVLFLSFLIGLEREGKKVTANEYRFGGVRTFPLLGLLGYTLSLASEESFLLPVAGLLIVGAFLWQSYRFKLDRETLAGMTTELSGLLTYTIGVLVAREHFWAATAVTVIGVGLLELKAALESFTRRVSGDEILTFAKFLLLSAVILPIVPNQTYGSFGFNPFRVWLVVVAVSAISYASYLLQVCTRGRGGILVSALLGGAYSSTVTTVVLARQAREQTSRPHLYSGAMLVASGVMYLRLLALLGIFNHQLLHRLGLPFLLLAAAGVAGGYVWTHKPDKGETETEQALLPKNPLDVGTAFLFAAVFVTMLLITHFALLYMGRAGLYALAGVMGVTDVDPFILSLAESPTLASPALAAGAIVIAAASNNFIKGIYAYSFGNRNAGRQGLVLLTALALLGLLPLFL